MKKPTKKIIGTVLAAAASLSIAFTSFAASNVDDVNTDNSTLALESFDRFSLKPIDGYKSELSEFDLNVEEAFSEYEYELVSEESYVDRETGLFFLDRTYIAENTETTATQSYQPFSKKVIKSRAVFENSSANMGDLLYIIDVSGTFSTGDVDHIYVTDAKKYVSPYYVGVSYVDKKFTYANNQGSNTAFGSKYAYIEYIATITFPDGHEEDIRLWLDVNVYGQETVHG